MQRRDAVHGPVVGVDLSQRSWQTDPRTFLRRQPHSAPQMEESYRQDRRRFVHSFLRRHLRRIEKPQHQFPDRIVLDRDCSGGQEVRPGMFGCFLHFPASHPRVQKVLKAGVSIVRNRAPRSSRKLIRLSESETCRWATLYQNFAAFSGRGAMLAWRCAIAHQ